MSKYRKIAIESRCCSAKSRTKMNVYLELMFLGMQFIYPSQGKCLMHDECGTAVYGDFTAVVEL